MNFSTVTRVLSATAIYTLLTQYSFHAYMVIKHVNLFKDFIKCIYLKLCFSGFWQRGCFVWNNTDVSPKSRSKLSVLPMPM